MGGLAMSAPLVVDDLVGVLVLGLGVDVGGGTTCSLLFLKAAVGSRSNFTPSHEHHVACTETNHWRH